MEPRPAANPFRESGRVLGIYLRGQILIALIVTGLYAVGWDIAKVPWWFAVAILCGVLNLVPKVGSLIALALTLWGTWANDGQSWQLITVFAVWVLVQGIEGFVLTPRILGKPLGLRPFWVFIAILVGSFVFGPLGFVLAVPALAVAAVFWRYFQGRRGRNADPRQLDHSQEQKDSEYRMVKGPR